jgi:class 3 adenylate cyclase/CHASE2 domain-containing sensor protein
MKYLRLGKSLKHIFVILLVTFTLLLTFIFAFSLDVNNGINKIFIYRTATPWEYSRVLNWQDWIYKHKQLTPSTNISIITIDDDTLNYLQARDDLNMFTIPKSVYIDLIEKLEDVANVKWIAIDLIFQNKDTEEQKFAEVLGKYNNLVLATAYNSHITCEKDQANMSQHVTCTNTPRSIYAGIPWGMINIGADVDTANTASYVRSAFVGWDADFDTWKGKVGFSGSKLETLPLLLYRITGWSGAHMPYLDYNSILNPYFNWSEWRKEDLLWGHSDTFDNYLTLSMKDVLQMSRVDLKRNFSGKYVFIGESGAGMHDLVDSPVTGTKMAWVELHAHFFDGLIQNKMLARVSEEILFSVLIALVLLMTVTYFFIPKFLSPIIAIVSFLMIIWMSRYLYDRERILVDIFPIFLAGVLPYIVTYIYRFFVVDREKRELQTNFGHYIDPEVVREIVEQDVPIELGGEKRELSILFSDIAGFTTLSEKLPPQDLFYLMTSYLSNMTDILIREGGTLDKYIGDAVMGFYGAPISHPDHAIRACRTALLMRERLPLFNADIVAHGLTPVDFRVGIATGEVMVGNIGSHDRFNYTVLGDTVNLASRLEGTGKEYHVHIIIAESARAQLTPEFFVRELDTIAVKGKAEWVCIYELIGFDAKVGDKWIYIKYEQALALYRTGKYREAGEIWATQMEIDPPSRMMVERCMAIVRGEVVVENGIFHMTHK